MAAGLTRCVTTTVSPYPKLDAAPTNSDEFLLRSVFASLSLIYPPSRSGPIYRAQRCVAQDGPGAGRFLVRLSQKRPRPPSRELNVTRRARTRPRGLAAQATPPPSGPRTAAGGRGGSTALPPAPGPGWELPSAVRVMGQDPTLLPRASPPAPNILSC